MSKKPYLKKELPGIPAGTVGTKLYEGVWRFGNWCTEFGETFIDLHPDFFGWRENDAERPSREWLDAHGMPDKDIDYKWHADTEPTQEHFHQDKVTWIVKPRAICHRCDKPAHDGLCEWQEDMEQARLERKLDAFIGTWKPWTSGEGVGDPIIWDFWTKDTLRRRPDPVHWDEADRIAHIGCVVRWKGSCNYPVVLNGDVLVEIKCWKNYEWKWAHEPASSWRDCVKEGI